MRRLRKQNQGERKYSLTELQNFIKRKRYPRASPSSESLQENKKSESEEPILAKKQDSPELQDKNTPELPYGLQQDINLLEYLGALLKHKYKIVFFALLLAILGYITTSRKPKMYESSLQMALIDQDEPGGVSAANRRFPEIAAMVEAGFLLGGTFENYKDVMVSELKSKKFTMLFIKEGRLMPHLYPEHWDKEKNDWLEESEIPTLKEAAIMFNGSVRFVNENMETGMMALRIRCQNPRFAAEWANRLIQHFNRYKQEQAIDEVTNKILFLKEELANTHVIEMKKAIYRLLEAKIEMAMLANVKDEYVFRIIDPALISSDKVAPKPKNTAILFFIGGIMLGVSVTIGIIVFKKLYQLLKNYQQEQKLDSSPLPKSE